MMLGRAASSLGIELVVLAPDPKCPAHRYCPIELGDYSDPKQVRNFADNVDILTFEFENVDTRGLEESKCLVRPSVAAMKTGADRQLEKELFSRLEIPTPRFQIAQGKDQLLGLLNQEHSRCLIKTCRGGYDGKGQMLYEPSYKKPSKLLETFFGQRVVLEELIEFDYEIAQIAVADKAGNIKFYPLTQTIQKNGVLHRCMPDLDQNKSELAQKYVKKIIQELSYVGVLAVEFFVKGRELIANEMAPRVHNSGHWTIEGAMTSQFENHLRAVLDMPLGSVQLNSNKKIEMQNILGSTLDFRPRNEGRIHDYRKLGLEMPGRKLGHVTFVS